MWASLLVLGWGFFVLFFILVIKMWVGIGKRAANCWYLLKVMFCMKMLLLCEPHALHYWLSAIIYPPTASVLNCELYLNSIHCNCHYH